MQNNFVKSAESDITKVEDHSGAIKRPLNLTGKGFLFLILGPSGVGKTSVIKYLRHNFRNLIFIVSDTTREIRPGEKNGEIYNFLEKEQFEAGIRGDKYLEWALVHQQNYYGVPVEQLENAINADQIVLREVDIQGLINIKKLLGPQYLSSVFLTAEKEDDLVERIKMRGKLSDEEIERRMASAKNELANKNLADRVVVSKQGYLEECCRDIADIMLEEAAKRSLNL